MKKGLEITFKAPFFCFEGILRRPKIPALDTDTAVFYRLVL